MAVHPTSSLLPRRFLTCSSASASRIWKAEALHGGMMVCLLLCCASECPERSQWKLELSHNWLLWYMYCKSGPLAFTAHHCRDPLTSPLCSALLLTLAVCISVPGDCWKVTLLLPMQGSCIGRDRPPPTTGFHREGCV